MVSNNALELNNLDEVNTVKLNKSEAVDVNLFSPTRSGMQSKLSILAHMTDKATLLQGCNVNYKISNITKNESKY